MWPETAKLYGPARSVLGSFKGFDSGHRADTWKFDSLLLVL
jgi:hypothetical protein